MTTPNRYQVVGNWKFVGEGKVFDVTKNEEFDGKLLFTTSTHGFETNTVDGVVTKCELHAEITKDEGRLWEMVVLDDVQDKSNEEQVIINDEELVEFIQSKVELTQEQIFAVLDLEFEFLKSKGVIEE